MIDGRAMGEAIDEHRSVRSPAGSWHRSARTRRPRSDRPAWRRRSARGWPVRRRRCNRRAHRHRMVERRRATGCPRTGAGWLACPGRCQCHVWLARDQLLSLGIDIGAANFLHLNREQMLFLRSQLPILCSLDDRQRREQAPRCRARCQRVATGRRLFWSCRSGLDQEGRTLEHQTLGAEDRGGQSASAQAGHRSCSPSSSPSRQASSARGMPSGSARCRYRPRRRQ